MIDLSSYEKAFAHLPEGARAAEVNAERTEEITVQVAGGKLIGSEAFTRTKLYVRVSGSKTGMAYTEKLDEDAEEIIRRALQNAEFATTPTPEPMNAPRLETQPVREEMERIEDMVAFGAEAERLLPGGRVSSLSVTLRRRELRTLSSLGLDVTGGSYSANATMAVSIPRAHGVAEGEAYLSAQSLAQLDPAALAEKAFAEANAMDGGGLAPVAVPSGVYTCVLSGQVMRNLWMTAWQTFAAASIQRGASSARGAGDRVGSAAFNVTNAPCHPLVGDAWPMDSEGTPVQTTRVVERGVLKAPLYTLSSAAKDGVASTGSAGRVARMTGDVPIALTTVPALIYVEPGNRGPEALVERMGDGLLLTYSLDLYHSVNVASGEFSVPCGGVLYKEGKPVGSVSQITMAGNLRALWAQIVEVANDLDFTPFYFNTYDVGSPSALVEKVTIAS